MTKVEVLTAPGCAHCMKAKKYLEELQENYDFELEIKDLTENPQLAQEYDIMTSPGIVIDGEVAFQGGVKKESLKRKLEKVLK